MDVNGTRFHSVLGATDWARCTVEDEGRIALTDEATLQPLLFRFPAPGGAEIGDPVARRRGAARDRYGNWYWVDESQAQVLARSTESEAPGQFWPIDLPADEPRAGGFGPVAPPPPPAPCRFGGIAVTEDHYLVIGTLDEPGLLIFDLHAGGRPRHVRWPDGVPFQPFDLAAAPGGGLFILDRENARYWALDRHLGVIAPAATAAPAESFRRADGQPDDLRPPPVLFPGGLGLDASSPLGAVDAVAIEALPDGSVLVFDRGPAPRVLRYRLADFLGEAALDLAGVLADPPPPGQPLFGADLALLGDTIYVPSADGEQAYAFAITWQDAPLALSAAGGGGHDAPFMPMRLFGGKGLVAAGGRVWYDFDGTAWVPLVEQKRPRFVADGAFETPPFDGREPGCTWHRLFIDGCVPPQAQVEVWSRTADEPGDLERAPWAPERAPRRRASGSELPLVRPTESSDAGGTFEILFQRARGRWLQLRFRLRGDGRTSPRLRALRIWYPRFSYLAQYLPAVYREDADSASFLDRFLANLEGMFTGIEDKMAVAHLLLDARTAPPEALDWLAGFFGVALDPAWDEGKRRLFLRHGMDFFRMRGTVRGITTALRLVIDPCADERLFSDEVMPAPASIRIVEQFRLRRLPAAALGDPGDSSGIRQVAAPPAWTPEQGGAALDAMYRLAAVAAGSSAPAGFPVFEPGDGSAPLWHRFVREVLSLSRTAGPGDGAAWLAFLTARYPTVAALDDAWRASFAEIAAVPLPAAVPGDGAPLFDWYQFQLGNGRFLSSGTRWIPAQGRDALLDRWRQTVTSSGLTAADFPVAAPADPALAAIWRDFTAGVLGFTPATDARSAQAWRDFLARRYRRIAAFNLAHAASATRFADLSLPAALPADGAPLRDWHEFQSVALATRRSAHRFTVLLPVPAREAFAVTLHQQRRELARRIVALEKPAHTLFDVKFYWAMFRVGEARIEVDTLLDVGSRAPELMPPLVLGQGFLSESHLAGTPPERWLERRVVPDHSLFVRKQTEEKRS